MTRGLSLPAGETTTPSSRYYSKGPHVSRRPKGGGSVYFRARDGLWVAYVPVAQGTGGRKRKHVASRLYCGTLKKLRNLQAAEGTPVFVRRDAPRPRMTVAREMGRHTQAEWAELYLASRGLCFYCREHANPPEKDHKVPIARGGDDGIGNIVVSCGPCNSAKGTKTVEEFTGVAA